MKIRHKIFRIFSNLILHMNWDYISGKKEKEKKHKKKKKTSITKIYDFFIRKLDSVLKKKWLIP